MNTGFWLLSTAALTASMWIPYVLDRMVRLGIARSLGNPVKGADAELSAWAQRAKAAHANAAENLVHFAPLALLVIVRGGADAPLASQAAATYFFARLVHYVVYAAGIPGVRTVAFLAGFGAEVALVFAALATEMEAGGGS